MSSKEKVITAYLYAAEEPNAQQKERMIAFLEKQQNGPVELVWMKDERIRQGFRLKAGLMTYDWTVEGRLRQMKSAIKGITSQDEDIIPLIKKTIADWKAQAIPKESGLVKTVGDGIATVSGLEHVAYGEILIFNGGVRGMVQDLRRNEVGCILFGDDDDIVEGSIVHRTGRRAGVPVGTQCLGRVVDALGSPIDGKGAIETESYMPIEHPAPDIIHRQSVNTPMETGLLAIDSMFPIGRGQRELIIGDRQTGKTTIAVDTILNQKGKNVICVYVAIGQKASSVAQLVENLRKNDAMDYTVVVNASAGDSVPLQYIAPYTGCTIGEFFMNQGKDVLIVYDDLSKHAVAYRALSLLLERSPGREAYPGDVFYLHSRLLERSAHLSDDLGGGSMTALPIVETQAGDVAAYIPTNIISITDGQIFLESSLFFAGQRPAVNVGLSVSRVGGDAQTKAMKKAAGTIRLELAQYREMEVFTQFSSDLDEGTRMQLAYGEGLMRLLRQPIHHPLTGAQQVILLTAATAHIMQNIPAEKIGTFKEAFLDHISRNAAHLEEEIVKTRKLDDELKREIIDAARQFLLTYENGIYASNQAKSLR